MKNRELLLFVMALLQYRDTRQRNTPVYQFGYALKPDGLAGSICNIGVAMAIVDVKAEIAGTVWKVTTQIGDAVEEDDQVMILESMKMEIPVLAPEAGVINELLVEEGATVTEGTVVARLEV